MELQTKEQLQYAADMAHSLAVSYRRCAIAAPVLLAIFCVVIGLSSGSWWQVILYGVVFLAYYPKWRNKEKEYLESEAEIRAVIESGIDSELSAAAQEVYNQCSASPKALWFGIISLGIIVIVCFVMGGWLINLAYDIPPQVPTYKVPDVSILVVGLFLLLLGCYPLKIVLSWIALLPLAAKLSNNGKNS